MIVAILMIENILIIFKELLAAAIPDEPGWIEDEKLANMNRVKQTKEIILDKTIVDVMDETITPLKFLQDKLEELHYDRDLSALLVPKLLHGCKKFMDQFEAVDFDATDNLNIYERTNKGGNNH